MNKRLLILLIIILLISGGIYWVWQSRSVAVPVVTEPVVVTKPSIIEQYPQHIEAIPNSSDEVWYNIPEFGVRMKLNKGFAEELIYKADEDMVSFQTKSIIAASSQCSVESADFGYIYKVNGTIYDADRNNVSGRGTDYFSALAKSGMIMQFPNFFIVLSADHADACWWGKVENKAAEEAAHRIYSGRGYQSVYAAIKGKSVEAIFEKE